MMVVLVDLPLTVVDDRVGVAVAVLCDLVAGREGLDVYEGLLGFFTGFSYVFIVLR